MSYEAIVEAQNTTLELVVAELIERSYRDELDVVHNALRAAADHFQSILDLRREMA